MTVDEILPKLKLDRAKILKMISSKMKDKAKDNNPGEGETPSGVRADPHQGAFDSLRTPR